MMHTLAFMEDELEKLSWALMSQIRCNIRGLGNIVNEVPFDRLKDKVDDIQKDLELFHRLRDLYDPKV